MDIRGESIVIRTEGDSAIQVRLLLSLLKCKWPSTVVEADGKEFFVYKDSASQLSWTEHGRTDENAADMVHIISEDGQLTIVHECLDEREIRNIFTVNRFFLSDKPSKPSEQTEFLESRPLLDPNKSPEELLFREIKWQLSLLYAVEDSCQRLRENGRLSSGVLENGLDIPLHIATNDCKRTIESLRKTHLRLVRFHPELLGELERRDGK